MAIENKFAIGIPTLNRFDLLHPALLFYLNDFPNTTIYIVDNGKQGIAAKITHPNIVLIEPLSNLGVAASWNLLCDKIYEKHEYAIILNDDVYLGKKDYEIDNLLNTYKKNLFTSTKDFCVFIMPKKTFELVGRFDQDFWPGYYEDNDYLYRMKLMKLTIFRIPFLIPYVYRNTSTIEKEPNIRQGAVSNSHLYRNKWGGNPGYEKYNKPYNKDVNEIKKRTYKKKK